MFEHFHVVIATPGFGQDRIKILESEGRLVIALADGSGGRSGGAEAADMVVSLIASHADVLNSDRDCEALLRRADEIIANDKIAGETTAVAVVIKGASLFGASVGDSGAWIVSPDSVDEVTAGQIRKPCLGTGAAYAAGFSRKSFAGVLMVATDGLLKYTSRERIADAIRHTAFQELPKFLSELVRYPSGVFPDDLAVAVCRIQ